MSAHDEQQIQAANDSGRTPVVFVHGLWLLPSSWDRWVSHFDQAGYAAVSLSWPDDPDTVAEANSHPELFAGKTVGQVADHLGGLIGRLDRKPAVIGHSFAEETVVAESCVLPLPDGIPLTDAALLGCAVLTGYGAVHHSARVREGETVAVFGVGGVGLATVQAARIAGASRIVAVDVSPEKEELARAAGATDYVVASDTTPRAIRALTGKQGVDVSVECVGRAVSIRAAWESTRRGGRTTVVGIGGKSEQVTFNALELFHWGRTLSGCVYGNSDPARDLPVLAEHVRAGRLDLGALVTERIALDGIPAAFENMLAGKGGRALVVF
ncbi:zinc-binding dehydrogenase [Streptomyces sp. NPDC005921]